MAALCAGVVAAHCVIPGEALEQGRPIPPSPQVGGRGGDRGARIQPARRASLLTSAAGADDSVRPTPSGGVYTAVQCLARNPSGPPSSIPGSRIHDPPLAAPSGPVGRPPRRRVCCAADPPTPPAARPVRVPHRRYGRHHAHQPGRARARPSRPTSASTSTPTRTAGPSSPRWTPTRRPPGPAWRPATC